MTLYVVNVLITDDDFGTPHNYIEVLPKALSYEEEAIEYMRNYDLKDLTFGHVILDGPYDDYMALNDRSRFLMGLSARAYFRICKVEW